MTLDSHWKNHQKTVLTHIICVTFLPMILSGLFEECSLKKLALAEENGSGSCLAMKSE